MGGARMRASDTDRNQALTIVRDAHGEGKLTLAEFEDRSQRLLSARYVDELGPLVADVLPSDDRPVIATAAGLPTYPLAANLVRPDESGSGATIAIMAGSRRYGTWVVAPVHHVIALMGEARLDLRNAIFTSPFTEIDVYTVMGDVRVIVPPELSLDCDGNGFMGNFHQPANQGSAPNTPHVRIRGLAVMAGVHIIRAQRDEFMPAD